MGVITDTMCAGNHAAMKVTPDAKCVKECVADGKTFQYALVEGTKVYKLSDQETRTLRRSEGESDGCAVHEDEHSESRTHRCVELTLE